MTATLKIDNDDVRAAFVDSYVAGATNPELCDLFSISPNTVKKYIADPRVQAEAGRAISVRANAFVRKIDTELGSRLDSHARHMSVDELLKIRKELADKTTTRKVEISGSVEQRHLTAGALWAAIEDDPSAIDRVSAVLEEPITDAEVVDDGQPGAPDPGADQA